MNEAKYNPVPKEKHLIDFDTYSNMFITADFNGVSYLNYSLHLEETWYPKDTPRIASKMRNWLFSRASDFVMERPNVVIEAHNHIEQHPLTYPQYNLPDQFHHWIALWKLKTLTRQNNN